LDHHDGGIRIDTVLRETPTQVVFAWVKVNGAIVVTFVPPLGNQVNKTHTQMDIDAHPKSSLHPLDAESTSVKEQLRAAGEQMELEFGEHNGCWEGGEGWGEGYCSGGERQLSSFSKSVDHKSKHENKLGKCHF
jgi:hypothetical protein